MYSEGFWIKEALGNNKFSYDKRKQKQIYVPKLIESDIKIEISDKEAFVEINEDGVEELSYGLKYFIKRKDIYIFDNHNHCYYFYKKFLKENALRKLSFIHIDQHKDMREPEKYFDEFVESEYSSFKDNKDCDEELYKSFLYANFGLNVGNFIKPLLKEGKIDELYIIDSEYKMDEFGEIKLNFDYVLDLDLDFFSEDMDYIDIDKKINFVKDVAKSAKAIFVASSPFFISFERAKKALYDIFEIENN